MKQAFVLTILSLLCIAIARAGDVSVKVTMTTGPSDDPKTVFASDTSKIYAMFKTTGAKNGDKIRGVLIAEDVGDAAPANTQVFDKTIDLEGDTDDGDFNFGKPNQGWPVGKYRVDVYLNGELATTTKFTVKAAAKKKSSDNEEEESGD